MFKRDVSSFRRKERPSLHPIICLRHQFSGVSESSSTSRCLLRNAALQDMIDILEVCALSTAANDSSKSFMIIWTGSSSQSSGDIQQFSTLWLTEAALGHSFPAFSFYSICPCLFISERSPYSSIELARDSFFDNVLIEE